jgi:hypothetical protein
MASRTRRQELSFRKKLAKLEEKKELISLLKSALASPVISGLVAYDIVLLQEKLMSQVPQGSGGTNSPSTASSSNPIASFLETFAKDFLVGTGILTQSTVNTISSLTSTPYALDFTALKTVILVYIASGGNLPGILQSSSSLLTTALQGIGIGATAAT